MRWNGLEPALVPAADGALRLAARYGVKVRVTSVRRNWGEQEELYARYKAGLSEFPANVPGDSPHQYGVAWDSTVPPEQQQLWDRIRAYFGWKLYPHDPVHAEYPNWRQYRAVLTVS